MSNTSDRVGGENGPISPEVVALLRRRPPRKKGFDCIKMQDEAALAIYEVIKDMNPDEELAYWAEQTRLMREEQQRSRATRETQAQPSAP